MLLKRCISRRVYERFFFAMFFAESQIFFVPMMPLLKIKDVSGQARFLVSANSLNELKDIKASLFLLNYFWLVFIKQSVKERS